MTLFTRHVRTVAMATSLAFGALAATPHVALAQPTAGAADLESARDLIVKGRELRDKGDLAGAVAKFKSAHALAHTPITGIELARTHVALKQPLEARDVCFDIGRTPVTRDETSRSKDARDEAAKIAEAMKGKIATIAITVTVPAGRTSTVKIDGVEVPTAALTDGRKVNPGKHVITARIDDGPESSATAELGEGETKTVALTPTVPAIVVKRTDEPNVPRSLAKPPEYVEEKRISPLVPVGLVVAGLGVGVGSVSGILAMSKKSDLDCTPNNECSNTSATSLVTAKAMADVSTVAFIIGGVGAAVGLVGLLTPSTVRVRRGDLRISPYVAGTEAGVHGSF
jgi:hypothetical protein